MYTTYTIIAHIRSEYKKFEKKSENSLECFLRRFMRKRLLVYRKPTHIGMKLPDNVEEVIKNFKNNLFLKLTEYNVSPSRLINMDETPLYYCPTFSQVIALKGSTSVEVEIPKKSDNRLSLILAVSSDGYKFPPSELQKVKLKKK